MGARRELAAISLGVWLVLLAGAAPLMPALQAPVHGDVRLYRSVAEEVWTGQMPYRYRHLEYPPYAIPILLIPRLWLRTEAGYQDGFAALVLLADSVLKYLLLARGFKHGQRWHRLLPLALYCLTIPFIRYFYLQRFDIFPALLVVGALGCFARGWFGWAGAILAVAGGMKLYPALLIPALGVVALRQGAGGRFAAGTALALLPLAVLSFFLPWWRFLAFHGERGLQVESLYASVVWLAHLLGGTEAQWVFVKAWTEVQGPLAEVLVPWAKVLMAGATLGAVGYACWVATRVREWNLPRLARLSLVPLLPFVAFNIVFSPQYMIWLLPLACLGILEGRKWPMFFIALATAVVPVWYPSPQFVTGFSLAQTLVLLGRNAGLVVVWLALVWEFWQAAKAVDAPEPSTLAAAA